MSASLVLLVGALVYHYAALKVFNAVVPKDANTELVAEAVAYGADPRQKLDVYGPSKATGSLPIVLFVYGGSWKDGYRSGYEFAGRAFAGKGYLTFVMDYRLMPNNRFPAFIEDVAQAIAWTQINGSRFGGDAHRLFIVGHSAGAYNLSLAVLNQKYLDAAGADQKLIRAIATMAGPFDFLPLDTKTTIETFGREPDPTVTQPISYARGDAPPFLLLTGTSDTTVFPKNSRNLARELLAKAGSVEIKEYVGVGHVGILMAIAKPFRSPQKPVLDDIVRFFAAHDVNPSN